VVLALSAAPAVAGESFSFYLDPAKWLDEHGETLTLARWQGRPLILSMGYPDCRKTCATTTLVYKEIQKVLDAQGRQAEFVLISFDEKSTAEEWIEFRRRRKLERANWHFLIGADTDVRRMARQIGVTYWFDPGHGAYLHDFHILLLGDDGRVRAEIDWDHMGEEDIARLFAVEPGAR
jgi:protein SCO1/2